MKVKFDKVIESLDKIFTKENLDKINKFLDNNMEYVEKSAEAIEEGLKKASEHLKKNTPKSCIMYSLKELNIESLKEVIQENRKDNAGFVALLNLGRNVNDKLELFMQYLNEEKKAIDTEEVYCIRCKMISDDLEDAFGNKEMLLINL